MGQFRGDRLRVKGRRVLAQVRGSSGGQCSGFRGPGAVGFTGPVAVGLVERTTGDRLRVEGRHVPAHVAGGSYVLHALGMRMVRQTVS